MLTRSQSKRTPLQKTPAQKKSRNTETTSSSKKTTLQKMPPAGNKKTASGRKRKRANSGSNPNPKRTKTRSSSEVCPLTTADIPDIVAAVTDAHWREISDAVNGSRRTRRDGSSSRRVSSTARHRSRYKSPSSESQPSSDETRNTKTLVSTVAQQIMYSLLIYSVPYIMT